MYDLEQVKTAYDELSAKVKADLDEQFRNNRIKGSDYANVYSQLIGEVLQLAFNTPLQEANIAKINKDMDLIDKNMQNIDYENNRIMYDTVRIQELTKQIDAQTENIIHNTQIQDAQSAKDLEVKDNQIKFTQRQIQGFDDKLKEKLMEIQMVTWSTMFSSGLLDVKPIIINNDEVSLLYNNIKETFGMMPSPIVSLPYEMKRDTEHIGYIANYNPNYTYTIETTTGTVTDINEEGEFTFTADTDEDSGTVRVVAEDVTGKKRVTSVDFVIEDPNSDDEG